jgi:hypothetical protein
MRGVRAENPIVAQQLHFMPPPQQHDIAREAPLPKAILQ